MDVSQKNRFFAGMKKCFVVSLLLILQHYYLPAQTQNRTAGWIATLNTIKLTRHFSLQADFHFRTSDAWLHTQTFIIRPGISFRFNPSLWVVLGYNRIHSRTLINEVSGYLNENQLWEQIWFRHPIQHFTMTHRVSFEQRFVPKPALVAGKVILNGREYVNRFRYWVRLLRPFQVKKTFLKGAYGVLQEEIFFNFGNTSAVNGHSFDQSRSVAALGYRFSAHFDMELGYQYRYIKGKKATAFNDNILQVSTLLRL